MSLLDAVRKFLDDIYWDETGDGSGVAWFTPEQINELRAARDAKEDDKPMSVCGKAYVPYYGTPDPGTNLQEHRHCERDINHAKRGSVCGAVGDCCQKGADNHQAAENALGSTDGPLQMFNCPDHGWRFTK